jgi:acrylyl-CoA reductase (NADPH)
MPVTSIDHPFRALRTHFEDRRISSRLERIGLDALSGGEVVIRALYAGVNYKDCLAVTGAGKIMSGFPRVGGIEVVGEVIHSDGQRIRIGDTVLVHGFGAGVEHDGGFSELVRVPEAHVMPLPAPLTAWETAVIGLPGFTVALALDRLQQYGVTPQSGPIAVSGAFGAVGMLALSILSGAGYEVVALTRRSDQAEALLELGASEVLDTNKPTASSKLLEEARFAGAIDNVGSETLSWLLKSMSDGGCVASVGNAGGNTFQANVLPFIMRRVQLFGIVANADWETRSRLWAKLAGAWKPDLARIRPHVHEIGLDQLLAHCKRQIEGANKGRTLVRFQ